MDYFDLLGLLLAVDVFWILSMGFLQRLSLRRSTSGFWSLWRRREVPYGWAALNAGLLFVIWGLGFSSSQNLTAGELWFLVGINVSAFVLDVFVLNYYLNKEVASVTKD